MCSVELMKAYWGPVKVSLLAMGIVALQACSGGSGGSPNERGEESISASASSGSSSTSFVYRGPVPNSPAIQNFKTAFYDNLVTRCGNCHTTGGEGTTAFVDQNDVNVAYNAALSVVNLQDPASSEVVTRVGAGHNCWENSTATCALNMTGYIENWRDGASASVNSVSLSPRDPQPISGFISAPETYTDAVSQLSFDLTASPELMYLLQTHCSGCHTGSSPTPQSPYFASSDPTIAYQAMLGKIDLTNPANSRLVVRLENGHNCWSSGDCAGDATTMQSAIQRFADDLPPTTVDSNLVISMAQILEQDGIIASGGGRYENDVIAKWEFREGEGDQVADTSGVQPEITLQAYGNYEWFGGWGMRMNPGARLQGGVDRSVKLQQRLVLTGEYTIEAWVAPNNVTQENAWIVGYAGGPNERNTLLTQTMYNYDFYNRSSSNPQPDGGPVLSTPNADELAQATLQHVVVTYDPTDGGRKIYVNGEEVDNITDPLAPGNLADWSEDYAVVLGNNLSGSASWEGVLRMVAIHSRALDLNQVRQNYDVGVGQKYFLMFSVSALIDREGVCHSIDGQGLRTDYCYIVFEVGQFDNTSYLFKDPKFVNINPDATGTNNLNFNLRGIYLGMNGRLVRTGQGFVNIDTVISGPDDGFTIDGQPLLSGGSIVPLENGADSDVFFLAFEEIAGNLDTRTPPAVGAFSYSYQDSEQILIGMRTFDEINESFSHITGVPKDSSHQNAATGKTIADTYDTVRRSLPSTAEFQTFMASHQMAIMQLAAAYCDALVEDTTLRSLLFTDGTPFDFNASRGSITDTAWRNRVIVPLIDRAYAAGLNTQPTRAHDGDMDGYDAYGMAHREELREELLQLINGFSSAVGTEDAVKAACTTVLSSAPATMK